MADKVTTLRNRGDVLWVGHAFHEANKSDSSIRVATWNVCNGLCSGSSVEGQHSKLHVVCKYMVDFATDVIAVTEPGCTIGQLRCKLAEVVRAERFPHPLFCFGSGGDRYILFITTAAVGVRCRQWVRTTWAGFWQLEASGMHAAPL